MKEFKLDEHPKIESGFKAPDGYFDSLQQKINSRINQEPKVIPINRRKSWIYSAAAVLVIGLGITVFNARSVESNALDAIAIENYLASQGTTETLVVEALEIEDIEQLSANYPLDDQAIEELLSNTNVEQYITD